MNSFQLDKDIKNHTIITYSRSSGPGGQNVNKVNSKVTLHLPLDSLESLGEDEIETIKKRLAGRINAKQELILQVQESRRQENNKKIAFQRLKNLLLFALVKEKTRKKTAPPKSAVRVRLKKKEITKQKKELRKPINRYD